MDGDIDKLRRFLDGKSKRSKKVYFDLYTLVLHIKQYNGITQLYPDKAKDKTHYNRVKARLHYHVQRLKNIGFITKKGYGTWEITDKYKGYNDTELKRFLDGKSKKGSLGSRSILRPRTNLHALQLNFPILDGKIDDTDWDIKEQLKNWIPKYTKLGNLGGLTLKNNNNKSLTVFIQSRNITELQEVDDLAFRARVFIYEYFRRKGVKLDIYECQTKNVNIATEDRECRDKLKKGEKFELDLDKPAEKIFPADDFPAKAWLDGSPFDFTAETNDKDWKREYLSMPFRVRDFFRLLNLSQENIAVFAEHLKSHSEMVIQTKTMLQKINQCDECTQFTLVQRSDRFFKVCIDCQAEYELKANNQENNYPNKMEEIYNGK